LQAANVDPDVRVVIITGAGRGFCSGLDLKAQSAREGERPGYKLFDIHNSPPVVLNRMDKPVICALNGPAAGYGMDLALGCDVRIASENARLHAVFGKRNVVPESGGTWYLPRIIGWAKAAEIAFLSEVVTPERGLELGLLNKVVPHDELLPEARRWAEQIASSAPMAIQATKRMMRLGLEETFESAVDHTMLQLLPLFGSEDFKESLAAFAERRDANFQGR
jgi:enoyl-CoA hydratase/carnithine racemase